MAHELVQLLIAQDRRRHAGEGRELIDHAADIADMADDGIGAGGEGFAIRDDILEIFPFQALGRELDRGQRILDLMRDAARDIGPGRFALRRLQIGYVVERDHITLRFALQTFRRDANEQHMRAAGAHDLHLRLRQTVGPAFRFVIKPDHFGNDLGKILTDMLIEIGAEQQRGRAVRQVDAALLIEADHTGRNARQHGLGETPALIELPVGFDQLALLALELMRHAVEGAR